MPETPRYVDKSTGLSTEHAKKMAEQLDHTSRADFKEIVKAQQFPPKNGLNFKNAAEPHIATKADSRGVLDLLKRVNTATRLGESKYAQLSYGHMFKKINVEMPNSDLKEAGKIYDINALEPGDKVWLDKGVLWVKRRDESKFASWGCEIYPWTEEGAASNTAAPTAPTAPTTPGSDSAPDGAPTTPTAPTAPGSDSAPDGAPTTPTADPPELGGGGRPETMVEPPELGEASAPTSPKPQEAPELGE